MSQAFYSKRHLLEAFKKANDESVAKGGPKIPYSYKSLIFYEKLGIIPAAQNAVGLGVTTTWRLYTKEEIDQAVQKLIDYKNKGLLKDTPE